ncbi:MAG: Gfo/Idh/MocA family oxidoreductase [Kiritimatiellae bacterium]|nr:Gfo/Idh/MocA family oxidoreductase [Kiritimatiellia bacterium]MDD5523119.1 Gfo/Idh/MocA family oxidoreductase [Kiritimatiellia bacterium]
MKTNRRSFLKTVACIGGMSALLPQTGCKGISGVMTRRGASMAGFRAEPLDRIRVGIIGIGARGTSFVRRLAAIPDVDIKALCDIREERVVRESKILVEKGRPMPAAYTGSEEIWHKLCELKDIDVVYVITPFLWHVPMALYAMQCGKHAAVEVPAALTIEDCWRLVDTAEATRRHCMILENCCYGFNEMLALNLCRKGVLGDLVHGEAGYIHYTGKSYLEEDLTDEKGGQWRQRWYKQHTGNAYPTHGLGPVCQYMGINRGDRMEALTSMSSASLTRNRVVAEKYGKDSPQARDAYKMGDVNTSIIRTRNGRTIMVQFATSNPRPYSRINMISGMKGIFADYPLRVALEPDVHDWMDENKLKELKDKYVHPLWDKNGEAAKKMGGHGGVDFLMDLRFCYCLKNGLPLDIDVYDTASWSSIVELSERSVLHGGTMVEIPDFTRGGWETVPPLGIVTM